ncbi:glycosyltransferase [Rufibacter tibetensis]|uniref:Glycosyl transferase family 1 n=1 Tax=Rufibacter tibetensis TaxID=512763 RepID=A0A0P0CSY5_9BACT|nr:glycosyltransferase [Rufibacter tibetensis]ALI98292.1 glycosyl transferase family 1 [Rufibacter tibetensis]
MVDKPHRRVLMTTDSVGGVWTYSLELIRALAPHNVHFYLATMGAAITLQQRQELVALTNVTVYESEYQLEWMDNPWAEVDQAGEWLLELSEQLNPDLIHLNNFCHGQLPWNKPVLMVIHSCVQTWWRALKSENAPSNWNTYFERVRDGLHAADLVIAPTQAMLEEATAVYGQFTKKKVINNGRDPHAFHFGQKEPFIFSMGRVWDEAKNIALLTQVADQVSWPIYIAGDAVHPSTGDNKLFKNVHFLGKLSQREVADWLSRASLYVLPAMYEPFGLSILEAAFSGCALVLGKINSLKEIWGTSAEYVNTNDAYGLATILQKLIKDEFLRNIMACRAVKKAQDYTTELMAQEYLQAYASLPKREAVIAPDPVETL